MNSPAMRMMARVGLMLRVSDEVLISYPYSVDVLCSALSCVFNATAQAFERLGTVLVAAEHAGVAGFDGPRSGQASGVHRQTTEPNGCAVCPSSQGPVARRGRAYPTLGLLAGKCHVFRCGGWSLRSTSDEEETKCLRRHVGPAQKMRRRCRTVRSE